MISVRCPHCHVGLKVDEHKLPAGIHAFKCPSCQGAIPVSLLSQQAPAPSKDAGQTSILPRTQAGIGVLHVEANGDTDEQQLPLQEGQNIVGRKAMASRANVCIHTFDKSMSREHLLIEVKKDGASGYKHFLQDNNSKNQTLYNGNCLGRGEIVVLSDGDEIVIGHTLLRFRG
jgi:predicted Zn finger-like uncharacterized protein